LTRYLSKTRDLFWALALRTKFKAADGNLGDAGDDLLVSLRFGTDLRKRLRLPEQLVGIAISRQTVRTGFQILDRVAITPPLLESLQRRLMELAKDDVLVDLRACVRSGTGILPVRSRGIGVPPMLHGRDAHATKKRLLTHPLRLEEAQGPRRGSRKRREPLRCL